MGFTDDIPLQDLIPYKRSRFQTRLPKNRLYTASHFWLAEVEAGLWRVGFTRFATRMLGEIVESGLAKDTFTSPAHPYTRGLLESLPTLGRTAAGENLGVIPGQVRSLIGGIEGCAFYPRCAHAQEQCLRSVPWLANPAGQGLRCVLGFRP